MPGLRARVACFLAHLLVRLLARWCVSVAGGRAEVRWGGASMIQACRRCKLKLGIIAAAARAMAAHSESEPLAGDGEIAGEMTKYLTELGIWRKFIRVRAAQPLVRKEEKRPTDLNKQKAWHVLRPSVRKLIGAPGAGDRP